MTARGSRLGVAELRPLRLIGETSRVHGDVAPPSRARCPNNRVTSTLNPTITLTAPLIGLTTGAIAGILPALKAAQTPPAATLRA